MVDGAGWMVEVSMLNLAISVELPPLTPTNISISRPSLRNGPAFLKILPPVFCLWAGLRRLHDSLIACVLHPGGSWLSHCPMCSLSLFPFLKPRPSSFLSSRPVFPSLGSLWFNYYLYYNPLLPTGLNSSWTGAGGYGCIIPLYADFQTFFLFYGYLVPYIPEFLRDYVDKQLTSHLCPQL